MPSTFFTGCDMVRLLALRSALGRARRHADLGLVLGRHDPELHEQLLELLHLQGLRHDEHLVLGDLPRQLAVLFRLRVLGRVLDHRHAAQLRALHLVVAWDEVDHLRPELPRERLDEVGLAVGVAGVADESGEPDLPGRGVLEDALGDVVGRVHGHHLAGDHDVDLLRLALADRHRKPAADHVAQHVVEDEVQVGRVGALLLEEVDGGDDAAAGAADPRLRAARLDALHGAVPDLEHVAEVEVLHRAAIPDEIHHRRLRLRVQDEAGGVGLRIAADDHHLLAERGEARDGVLRRRGLADPALAVNRDLPHDPWSPLSLAAGRWTLEQAAYRRATRWRGSAFREIEAAFRRPRPLAATATAAT